MKLLILLQTGHLKGLEQIPCNKCQNAFVIYKLLACYLNSYNTIPTPSYPGHG